MIAALAGGVGASRLLQGLVRLLPPREVTVIANTGDDIELYGLHISPDLDIIAYTMAGIVDENKGWGVYGDTFQCLQRLRMYGLEDWFQVGDRDLATHLYRTYRMRLGASLSKVTEEICERLGVGVRLIPMSDQSVQTMIATDKGTFNFQEYLVKRGMRGTVRGVRFKGIEEASPAPGVINSIMEAERIIICPSNPIVSIGPILSLRGVREALAETGARVVGVSPIIQGAPVKGPADRLMRGLNLEVSAFSVAEMYKDILDAFIIDSSDEEEKPRIERLGIRAVTAKALMASPRDKINLAKAAIEA